MSNDYLLTPGQEPPKVVFWFKLYAGFLAFIYLLVTGCSMIFFFVSPAELEMERPEALIMGGVFLAFGLSFLIASALPLFLKPRPWVWIYDLVIICLGLTSACSLPMCIPLLIFWLKPETKRHFGRVSGS